MCRKCRRFLSLLKVLRKGAHREDACLPMGLVCDEGIHCVSHGILRRDHGTHRARADEILRDESPRRTVTECGRGVDQCQSLVLAGITRFRAIAAQPLLHEILQATGIDTRDRKRCSRWRQNYLEGIGGTAPPDVTGGGHILPW